MAAVISAGELRDLADPAGGYRGSYAASTAGGGSGLTIADPGVPLTEYANGGVGIDPKTIWRTQPSVRKVVDFIARHIASVPFHAYERASDTDRVRISDGPLAGTLRSPRIRIVDGQAVPTIAFRFWHSIVVDWLVFDRWAALKTPSATRADRGLDLVRLPARRFTFEGDSLEEITGIKVVGREKPLHPATCLYDHGYSSTGKVGGTTPMQAISQVLLESLEATAWRRTLWRRGGRIPAVIERPKDAGSDWSKTRPGETVSPKDRFLRGWSNYMRGEGIGTPILEDGMKLQKVEAFSPTDVRDVEMRQLTDSEVASFFHIPPELVGAREGTFSNIDAFRTMLFGPTLGPYLTPIEQVLNAMLVPDLADPDVYVEANVEAKMRGSFMEQVKYLTSAIGAPYMTRAEGRGLLNLRDLGGETDQLVTPLNVTLGGLANPSDTAPTDDERDDDRS